MAKVLVTDNYLRDIGNAIRTKTGTSELYNLSQMASKILDITTGGGGGSGSGLFDIQTSAISGTYSLVNNIVELNLSSFTWMILAGTSGNEDEGIGPNPYPQPSDDPLFIPSEMYMNNTSLRSFSNSSTTGIGNRAFYSCVLLSRISFPACSYIGTSAFAQCISLSDVYAPNIQTIGSYAFENTALGRFVFSDNVTIGDYAFSECTKLNSISFGDSVSIGSSVFDGCTHLSEVYFLGSSVISGIDFNNQFNNTPIIDSSYYDAYGSIYVNPNLASDYANVYSSLSSRIVPYYEISKSQYASNSSLTSFEDSNAIRIRAYAFANCSRLSTISFQNCKFIETAAFQSCTALRQVYFPNVESMDGDVFREAKISSCDLPNLRYMRNAFAGCSSLKSLSVPKLEEIVGFASWTDYLSVISLPKLKRMPWFTLRDADALQKMYLMGSQVVELTNTDDDVSYDTYSSYLPTMSNCVIYVPSSLYSEYITDSVWMYCSSMIEGVNV